MTVEKFSGTDWTEIAALSALSALCAWLLYHHFHQSSAADVPFAQQEQPESNNAQSVTFPTLGLPPLVLPSYSSGGGTNNATSSCGGCAAGQTTSPTIQAIVMQTNAALAAMQNMVNGTVQQIAGIGDSENNGLLDFESVSGC